MDMDSQSQPVSDALRATTSGSEPSAAWRTMESAPKAGEGFFIGWLHLEKNPQGSAATIVSRVYRPEAIPPEDVVDGEVAEWFCVNGTYYPARYVTHWMPLPSPPPEAASPADRPGRGPGKPEETT